MKINLFPLAGTLAMMLVCLGTGHADDTTIRNKLTHPHRDGELIVKYREGRNLSAQEMDRFHGRHATRSLKRYTGERLEHLALENGRDLAVVMGELERDPDVAYVEPNYLVKPLALPTLPNDPWFDSLWGMKTIAAPYAWSVTTGSADLVIAVIDSGIDFAHRDLAGNVWPGFGYNALTGSADPLDDHGHGTQVAGIIGAVGNNSLGVTGLNWTTRLYSCKFIDSAGNGSIADAITCLDHIRILKDQGVNIVATNNSWGMDFFSQALYDAIAAQRDILFIAGAGNNGTSNDVKPLYPANYEHPLVLSVAATTPGDGMAATTNYGRRTVYMGAPGSEILSTTKGGGYGYASGTSTAAPHVAGLVGLVASGVPNLDWRGIRNTILSSGDPLATLGARTITGRRINASSALSCLDRPIFSALKFPNPPVAGSPATLSALSVNCADPVGPVTVRLTDGRDISLHDDGVAPDVSPGDGIFAGMYLPTQGTETFTFSSPAGSETVAVPQPTPLLLKLEPMALPSGTVGVSYSATLSASGGTTPYTWSLASGTLPAGLSLNKTTGIVNGTPTRAETVSILVMVSDATGMKDTAQYTLRITAPLSMITADLPVAKVGLSYRHVLEATGGVPPYTWLTLGVHPPEGFSLNPDGILSGIPTTLGTTTMTMAVVDSVFTSVTRFLSITVIPAELTIDTSALSDGIFGAFYNQNLGAVGGTAPYTWSLDSGELPAGLTLSGTGVISGTPSATGASSFTVRVTDTASPVASVTKTFTITVKPAATVSVNVALQANGGTATVSSTYNATNYPPASLNNGDRKGLNWGGGGGWNDSTINVYADWAQITFNEVKAISEVDVFTLQDNYTAPVEPTGTLTFTKYGITTFNVQYWNGTSWFTVPGGVITGNNLVWRKVSFPAVTTDRIRVLVNGALGGYSRIVEIEAYTPAPMANVPPTVTLTSPANGASFLTSETITIAADAADSDGTVSSVDFYDGTTLLFSDTVAPYSFSWSGMAAGTHTLKAVATDNAGAQTTSPPVTVAVNQPDSTPPTVTVFTLPATATSPTVAVTAFAANDNIGVTGYLITESAMAPAAGATGWSATVPATFTFGGYGVRTAYAWAKDAAGNVSSSLPATVTLTQPDTALPKVTLFTLPATATSLTVNVTGLTATDNIGVTGYLITESATAPAAGGTGWSATAPVTFTFSGYGVRTAYAWAKDAAGNVSESFPATVTLTQPDTMPPTVTLFTMPATATSLTVSVTGLTATDNIAVTGYLITESATAPATGAAGWSTTAPATFTFGGYGVRTAYAWARDAAGNVSVSLSTAVTITNPFPRTNVAQKSSGATASASSTITGRYSIDAVINGDRTGRGWNTATYLTNGGWNDATTTYPDYFTVTFAGSKTIDEIDVYTLQDSYATATADPTSTLTFTKYGIVNFTVQYWDGVAWNAVPGGAITNNNLVWRQIKLATPITTTQIRVEITTAKTYSRLVEIEAYGTDSGGGTSSYSITYDANGAIGGTVPVDGTAYTQGATVTVLGNTGALVKTGHTFSGWNTNATGSGITYAAGSAFAMGTANVTLYAQWAPVTSRTNVALKASGATATASSTMTGRYAVDAVINGDRTGSGWNTATYLTNGGWNDATSTLYPDWVEVTFGGTKTIDEIDVYTLQDAYATTTGDPGAALTFTKYGIVNFTVQYWDGAVWVTVNGGAITNNNLVWRQIKLPTPVTTDRIRVEVTASKGGYSRLVEIEAYGQ